jgi:hypothetical protein
MRVFNFGLYYVRDLTRKKWEVWIAIRASKNSVWFTYRDESKKFHYLPSMSVWNKYKLRRFPKSHRGIKKIFATAMLMCKWEWARDRGRELWKKVK